MTVKLVLVVVPVVTAGIGSLTISPDRAAVPLDRVSLASLEPPADADRGTQVAQAYSGGFGYGGNGFGYGGNGFGYRGNGYGYSGNGYGYSGNGYGYSGNGYGYSGNGYGYGGFKYRGYSGYLPRPGGASGYPYSPYRSGSDDRPSSQYP